MERNFPKCQTDRHAQQFHAEYNPDRDHRKRNRKGIEEGSVSENHSGPCGHFISTGGKLSKEFY